MGAPHKPSAEDVLDRLEAEAQAIAGRMALAVREEVAEYSGVAIDPAFAAQVLAHGMEHPREVREALQLSPAVDYLAEGADDIARRLVPRGTEGLIEADQRADGALSATLIAYAESDLNVARAAVALDVHANTVHYRLGRVHELSDRDPRRFADLVELITALRLLA